MSFSLSRSTASRDAAVSLLPDDPSEPHHVQEGSGTHHFYLQATSQQSCSVKRKHVHYTHVRTNNPSHKQPCSFTRAEFWAYVEELYKEAYPTTDATGSILSFGLSSL